MARSMHAVGETLMLRRRGLNVGAGVCCGMLAAIFSGAAWPVEWSVQPAVGAGVSHDDNPLLTTGPHESATVTTVTPTMHVRGRTERSDVDLGLVLNYNNYSTNQVEDTDQQLFLLKSSTQASERTRLRLDGEFRRDDLRRTVDAGSGIANEGDVDVGLIQTKVERKWRNLRPSWERALTERSSVGLSYNYRSVDFANSLGTGLVDFTDQTLSLTYSNKVSRRDSFNITANASRFRAPDVDNVSDTTRLLVGFARAFSETSRGSISVGATKTEEEVAGSTDSASGFVVQANATQRSDVSRLDGTVRHDVSPSGSGQSVESDQLRVRFVRRLTPKINFDLRATLLRNKSLQGPDPGVDRRYYEVEPALEYQWATNWFLRASYIYRYRRFDVDPTSATSNAVFVGVAYDWQRQLLGQ